MSYIVSRELPLENFAVFLRQQRVLPVISIKDDIDPKYNAVLFTQIGGNSGFPQILIKVAVNLDVSGFTEGAAGDGYEIDILTVLGQPGGDDFTTVYDDKD